MLDILGSALSSAVGSKLLGITSKIGGPSIGKLGDKVANSKFGKVAGMVGGIDVDGAAGAIGGLVSKFKDTTLNSWTGLKFHESLDKGVVKGALVMGAAYKAAEKIPGAGTFIKAANTATKFMNLIGIGNDGVTKIDALIGSTPLGALNFGVGKTDLFALDETVTNSTGYTGAASNIQKGQAKGGKKVGWMYAITGAKGKINDQIEAEKAKQSRVSGILEDNKAMQDAVASTSLELAQENILKKQGGFDAGAMAIGKEGMKILQNWAKSILEYRNSREANKGILKHAEGGKIGESSVIPGGALHAHKHNLKHVDKDLAKSVTHKGVPVVTFEEGGEVEQHAEIERGEIIFRKEITDQLEKLWKDGSEEAMILAGKLIAEEIIGNTIDKSGEYEIKN